MVLRDGVRDFTLARKGFDVWTSPVYTNWTVVGLFLAVFLLSLSILVWLFAVLRKAAPSEEKYA